MNFADEQRRLRQHLEKQGICDTRVLAAIERTRRDLFIPADLREVAYADEALPIAVGQTISQPYIVALMTQELALEGDEIVLEIGTGSGYQAAILSQLCREVVTIERHEELSLSAQQVLADLEYTNIDFYFGDGTLGYQQKAPYDGIIVTAAAPDVPSPLYNQLKIGGRLVIPVGDELMQTLKVIVKQPDGHPTSRNLCGCRFVKLIGEAGWQDA